MKSTIIENNEPKLAEYPCLKECGKLVVHFYERDCGMVVNGEGMHKLGNHSTSWDEDFFKPFTGKIQLEN